LKKNADYLAVYKNSRSYRSKNFIFLYTSKKNGPTRFGITVSKKVGGAVTRNYIKRCVKEILRKKAAMCDYGFDIVIISRKKASFSFYADFSEDISLFLNYLNQC